MEKKEVTAILEKLNSFVYVNPYKQIKNYSVEILESLAIELYKNDFEGKTNTRDYRMIHNILMERARKLNRNFTWTSENVDRFLKINDKLMEVYEKTYKEAKSVVSGLEKRIQDNDPFLKDYMVEIELNPCMYEPYKKTDDDFAFVLSQPIGFAAIWDIFSHSHDRHARIQDNKIPISIDKSKNWNIVFFDETLEGTLYNYYIGYPIHELLNGHWSLSDILKIKTIPVDLKIEYQHYVSQI
jgi:hypothetical protein